MTMEEKDQVDRREERECREWWIGRGRRNVRESFWFYCTFSIILRNSGKRKKELGQ